MNDSEIWIEFLGVSLDIMIGIHDNERLATQTVLLDVKIKLFKSNPRNVFDYDLLEEFLSREVTSNSFDYQEDLAQYITNFLFDHDEIECVDVSVSKPDAYLSGIIPGVRTVTSRET